MLKALDIIGTKSACSIFKQSSAILLRRLLSFALPSLSFPPALSMLSFNCKSLRVILRGELSNKKRSEGNEIQRRKQKYAKKIAIPGLFSNLPNRNWRGS